MQLRVLVQTLGVSAKSEDRPNQKIAKLRDEAKVKLQASGVSKLMHSGLRKRGGGSSSGTCL